MYITQAKYNVHTLYCCVREGQGPKIPYIGPFLGLRMYVQYALDLALVRVSLEGSPWRGKKGGSDPTLAAVLTTVSHLNYTGRGWPGFNFFTANFWSLAPML